MCFICFLSLKGGCYFAASVHIVDALFLLWTLIFEIIHVNKLLWYVPVEDDPDLNTYLGLIGAYVGISLILGSIIFRGIEMESPRVIIGGALTFLVLQVVAFILCLCWWWPIPLQEDPFGLYESARIGRFVIRTLATVAYMAILGLYARELFVEQRDSRRDFHKPEEEVKLPSHRKSPYYFT